MRELKLTINLPVDCDDIVSIAKLADEALQSVLENSDLALESVAELVLSKAKYNASHGYDDPSLNWQPRDHLTDMLYSLSPYHQAGLPGLDTGKHLMIESLERGNEDNIWEKGNNEITIGTKFKHASILENGGHRYTTPDWPSVGVGFSEGQAYPRKWLVDAVGPARAWEIVEQIMQGGEIPPRPFMAPAVRKVKDEELHTALFIRKLMREIRDDYRIKKETGVMPAEVDERV